MECVIKYFRINYLYFNYFSTMKKIFKISALVVVLMIGFIVGRVSSSNDSNNVKVGLTDTNKIVFINNDQSMKYNKGIYNYGNIEINKISDMSNYKSNKLNTVNTFEASNGLSQGEYAAAITIPSNFTESVLSINKGISSNSTITYEISDAISPKKQNEILEKVNSIVNDIKADISYMYIYGIFDSLHTSQAGAETVMSNMGAIYEFTKTLEDVNVFSEYDYDLEEIEDHELEQIDLTQQEQGYVDTINSYVGEVDNSVTLLQENIEINNQDFMKYLLSVNGDMDALLKDLESKVTGYEGAVKDEVKTMNGFTKSLSEVSLENEFDLVGDILEKERSNLTQTLSDEYDTNKMQTLDILKIFGDISSLAGSSSNFSDAINQIQNSENIINNQNNELKKVNFSKYVSTINSIDECLNSSSKNTCLADNHQTLKNIKSDIDNEVLNFNDNFNKIDTELSNLESGSSSSDQNLLNYINEVKSSVPVSAYETMSEEYGTISGSVNKIDSENQITTNSIEKLEKMVTLSDTEIGDLNEILNKDEISESEKDFIEDVCKDKTDMPCNVITNYQTTEKTLLKVDNALKTDDVDESQIEWVDDTCDKPLSIAYVYNGWDCTDRSTATHHGVNAKLKNQNFNIGNLNKSLERVDFISGLALENMTETINLINEIEVDYDEYKKAEYEDVDEAPYVSNIKDISQSVKEEYNKVEESNNKIYEGIYDTYMENFDSYQEYIDDVSSDTTYEDMIGKFKGEEGKRQNQTKSYLEELSELMKNSLTEGLPNRNIYNHIVNPLKSASVEAEKSEEVTEKSIDFHINWLYIIIISTLFIATAAIIFIVKKKV